MLSPVITQVSPSLSGKAPAAGARGQLNRTRVTAHRQAGRMGHLRWDTGVGQGRARILGRRRPAVNHLSAKRAPARPVELLSPAGGPDAAYAAFQFGADAIYLGLKKFSARAEAENFTLEELSEVVACAHALTPRRRVFVTVNTLIRNDELAELV